MHTLTTENAQLQREKAMLIGGKGEAPGTGIAPAAPTAAPATALEPPTEAAHLSVEVKTPPTEGLLPAEGPPPSHLDLPDAAVCSPNTRRVHAEPSAERTAAGAASPSRAGCLALLQLTSSAEPSLQPRSAGAVSQCTALRAC